MKKIIILILLMIIATTVYSQYFQAYNFEDTTFINKIRIDKVKYPNNKWQIGHPNKTVFTTAFSNPNAMVTDTLNILPPNDTSVFYIIHLKSSLYNPSFGLTFMYQLNGSINDRGIIEISPDKGQNWVNVLTQDSIYQMYWGIGNKPTLSGSTTVWKQFNLSMVSWAYNYGAAFPLHLDHDTIIYRFSYITDSSSTLRNGWLIDDLVISDFNEGVEEYNNNYLSIYPNPIINNITIETNSNTNTKQKIEITNLLGQSMYTYDVYSKATIDVSAYAKGIYIIKLNSDKRIIVKKFIKE